MLPNKLRRPPSAAHSNLPPKNRMGNAYHSAWFGEAVKARRAIDEVPSGAMEKAHRSVGDWRRASTRRANWDLETERESGEQAIAHY